MDLVVVAAGLIALASPGYETPPDSFTHTRHRAIACLTCHPLHGATRLTFQPPRGCQICHHQAASENRCATCHQPAEIAPARSRQVTVAVPDRPSRPRLVAFRHEAHARVVCTTCHTQAVSLQVMDSVRTCAACHDDHHQAARSCGTCHADRAAFAPHAPPADAHAECDACHRTRTIERLTPDRALCLTCHEARRDHHVAKECTVCHFQQDPASYRLLLSRRPRN